MCDWRGAFSHSSEVHFSIFSSLGVGFLFLHPNFSLERALGSRLVKARHFFHFLLFWFQLCQKGWLILPGSERQQLLGGFVSGHCGGGSVFFDWAAGKAGVLHSLERSAGGGILSFQTSGNGCAVCLRHCMARKGCSGK